MPSLDLIPAIHAPEAPSTDAGCPTICPVATPATALLVDTDDRHLLFRGCRRWSCPVCGKLKRYNLIRRIIEAKPNRFMTLTTKPAEHETPEDLYARTAKFIPRLFQKFERQSKTKTEYLRIVELTKRGYPHYHFLLRGPWWDQSAISRCWQSMTGAFIVDIRRVKGPKLIAYVAKYTTKDSFTAADTWWVRKRITHSRKFFGPDSPGPEWCDFTKPKYDHPIDWVTSLTARNGTTQVSRHNYELGCRSPGDEIHPDIAEWIRTNDETPNETPSQPQSPAVESVF